MWVWSLGYEDALEEGMATHSSILAWRIPQTEEPGGLQPIWSQKDIHDWATKHSTVFQLWEHISITCCSVYHNLNKYFKLDFSFSPAISSSRGEEGISTRSFIVHVLLPLRPPFWSLVLHGVVRGRKGRPSPSAAAAFGRRTSVTADFKWDPWWCFRNASCKE